MPRKRVKKAYLSYWRHGKLQGRARDAVAEVQLILLVEALALSVRRSAVFCDEGIHRDVDCGVSLRRLPGSDRRNLKKLKVKKEGLIGLSGSTKGNGSVWRRSW